MLCQKIPPNTRFQVDARQGMNFCLCNVAIGIHSTQVALFLCQGDKQILITELSRAVGQIKSMNINLEFDNMQNITLLPKGGQVHIIGSYKKSQYSSQPKLAISQVQVASSSENKTEKGVVSISRKQKAQAASQEIKTQNLQFTPARRSTRVRAPAPTKPVSAKTAKRQKQQLKSMAKYFECNLDDDDDDQDGSFSKQKDDDNDDSESSDSSSSSSDFEQEKTNRCRKIKKTTEDKMVNEDQIQGEQVKIEASSQVFSVPTRNPYK